MSNFYPHLDNLPQAKLYSDEDLVSFKFRTKKTIEDQSQTYL